MKSLKFITIIFLAFISVFVSAWGYQIFWNDIVLNVWQMFSDSDIVNTMKIPYSVFVVITVGLGLIKFGKKESVESKKGDENKDNVMDAVSVVLSKLCWIAISLLTISIVF